MTKDQYIINRKLNIIELGEKLGNISEACRRLGVSRQHFYDLKSEIEENGIQGLLEKSRRKPRKGNRVSDDIEQKILDYSLEFPTHGQVRVSNELLKNQGVSISGGGVRGVWLRFQLETKALRLKRLEKWSAENSNVLTESQVQALESAKEEKQAHGTIETHHPGFLFGQRAFRKILINTWIVTTPSELIKEGTVKGARLWTRSRKNKVSSRTSSHI